LLLVLQVSVLVLSGIVAVRAVLGLAQRGKDTVGSRRRLRAWANLSWAVAMATFIAPGMVTGDRRVLAITALAAVVPLLIFLILARRASEADKGA
jgi:hypothetical protein